MVFSSCMHLYPCTRTYTRGRNLLLVNKHSQKIELWVIDNYDLYFSASLMRTLRIKGGGAGDKVTLFSEDSARRNPSQA